MTREVPGVRPIQRARPIAFATALALVGTAVAIAQGATAPRPKNQDEVQRVSAEEAKKAVDAGTAVLVDVRDLGIYNVEHAQGAVSFNAAQPDALPKGKLIITYCT